MENWIICTALVAATCLLRWCYKHNHLHDKPNLASSPSQTLPSYQTSQSFLGGIFVKLRRRRHFLSDISPPKPSPLSRAMRYSSQIHIPNKEIVTSPELLAPIPNTKQPYEVFLVLDVEATCQQGTDFDFPNEIIEFPVCLMRWKNRSGNKANQLEVVEEFRSFVRPTWRPTLSQFCTDLTGITQEQVDAAPLFPAVLALFQKFIIKHGLIDEKTGDRLVRFCWCSDGPFDVRDFVVKQCFISKIRMPGWMQGDILDVRTVVLDWLHSREPSNLQKTKQTSDALRRRALNIQAQLKVLGLPSFEGRQHSGIDDSRNIAKIIAELARRGVSLHPNTAIHPNRRWRWMGKNGKILEEHWGGI